MSIAPFSLHPADPERARATYQMLYAWWERQTFEAEMDGDAAKLTQCSDEMWACNRMIKLHTRKIAARDQAGEQ